MLLRIRYNVKDRKTSFSGGASRGNTKSNDESVTEAEQRLLASMKCSSSR